MKEIVRIRWPQKVTGFVHHFKELPDQDSYLQTLRPCRNLTFIRPITLLINIVITIITIIIIMKSTLSYTISRRDIITDAKLKTCL